MLKGSKPAIVKTIQPVSIHGQISLDVVCADGGDPDAPVIVARIGPESVPDGLVAGDRVDVHFIFGVVTQITRRPD